MKSILSSSVSAYILLLFVIKDTMAIISTAFRMESVLDIVFCPEKEFEASSKIECSAICLPVMDFDNCSATVFKEENLPSTNGLCSCGRSNCENYGLSDTFIDILVNTKCVVDFNYGKLYLKNVTSDDIVHVFNHIRPVICWLSKQIFGIWTSRDGLVLSQCIAGFLNSKFHSPFLQ